MGGGSVNKKERAILQQLAEQLASDAELLARLLEARKATGHPMSQAEHDLFQEMAGSIANRVIFDLASIRYRVTVDSERKSVNARYSRSESLTRSQILAAANAYAAGGGVVMKGWKAGVLEHLRARYSQHHKLKRWDQVAPRLENAGLTADEIEKQITDWRPAPPTPKSR